MGVNGAARPSAWALAAIVAGALLSPMAGCGVPGPRSVANAIYPFVDAVQEQRVDLLECLYAGGAVPAGADRQAFADWLRAALAAYEEGAARGEVDLRPDGIAVVKAFGLGKGTFLGVSAVREISGGLIEADTPATFNYEEISTAGLPPGATFSVATRPLGRVLHVRVPADVGSHSEEVLKTLLLRWKLAPRRPTPECDSRWAVVSVAPVEGSETTARVTWTF